MIYDLLITGGEVLDPGAGLRGRMDVGIRSGKIIDVAPSLPADTARKTISARGKYITPGLIDIHTHIFLDAWDMGGNTDRFCKSGGVTTICDGGSTGSANFAGLRNLVEHEVRTKVRAFVNLSAIGLMDIDRNGELAHAAYADPEGCARTIRENPGMAIGVKLRFSPEVIWEISTEPLRLARMAADMAGAPMMVHITDTPLPIPEILKFMKPGDIVTHCLHGYQNGIMGPGKSHLLKEVLDAQKHGVIFDCAHGRAGHFNFPLLQKALDQGFMPNTISTDLTFNSATIGPVYSLATTMSKFLHFGATLEDVVFRATAAPASIIGVDGVLGTLKPGAHADIAIFDLREGDFELRDTDGNTVHSKRLLVADKTIKDGRIWFEREGE
jgi:dihydroorotase